MKICNKCGSNIEEYEVEGSVLITKKLGYGSAYDGSTLSLNICPGCLDDLIVMCVENPIVTDGFDTEGYLE